MVGGSRWHEGRQSAVDVVSGRRQVLFYGGTRPRRNDLNGPYTVYRFRSDQVGGMLRSGKSREEWVAEAIAKEPLLRFSKAKVIAINHCVPYGIIASKTTRGFESMGSITPITEARLDERIDIRKQCVYLRKGIEYSDLVLKDSNVTVDHRFTIQRHSTQASRVSYGDGLLATNGRATNTLARRMVLRLVVGSGLLRFLRPTHPGRAHHQTVHSTDGSMSGRLAREGSVWRMSDKQVLDSG